MFLLYSMGRVYMFLLYLIGCWMQAFAPSPLSSLNGFKDIFRLFSSSPATKNGSSATSHQGGVYGQKTDSRPLNARKQGEYFGGIVRDCPTGTDQSEHPLIVAFPDFSEDATMKILSNLGIHAPQEGMIGRSVSGLVMHAGSVISGHAGDSPHNRTITVLKGRIVVLAFPFALNSPINKIQHDVDLLVQSSQVLTLIAAKFKPFVFEVLEKSSLSLRAGTYHVIVATEDSGQSMFSYLLKHSGCQFFGTMFLVICNHLAVVMTLLLSSLPLSYLLKHSCCQYFFLCS